MLAGMIITACAGGTFLSWSIYYLSGASHHYDARRDILSELPQNPLDKNEKTAHNFHSNLTRGLNEFNQCFDRMADREDLNVLYMYEPYKFGQDDIIDRLRRFDKILYVDLGLKNLKYFSKFEGRALGRKLNNSDELYSDWEEAHLDYLQTFFSSSLEKFGGIDTAWDHREFLALNLDYNKIPKISDFYDRSQFDHFYIDNSDVWTRLDQIIEPIFDYLEIEIDQTRKEIWARIYDQWKVFHTDRINFYTYFDSIVDAILKGINMDLTRFKLDVVQEAALLRSLIYDHGFNLKAHGLTKFTNTRDLHTLLEPNFHELTH